MSDHSAKRAREWARANAKPCPCCAGGVVIAIDGGAPVADFMRELNARGARVALVAVEDAEATIAAQNFKPVQPIGGRV